MIKCIIVDDEILAIELLQDYISKLEGFDLIGSYTNPIEALQQIENLQVDLVFLDVQMPELNGIQFLKIKQGKCHFVMTTAYSKYALEGYEHDVIDYLLKPISFDRFMISMERVRSRLQSRVNIAAPEVTTRGDFIFVKSEYKTIKINLRDIFYLEGMSDYVSIHLKNNRVLTLDTLKKFLSRLPDETFIRVHKSYIVNIEKIDLIERNRIMLNGTNIPIGATYLKSFQNIIGS